MAPHTPFRVWTYRKTPPDAVHGFGWRRAREVDEGKLMKKMNAQAGLGPDVLNSAKGGTLTGDDRGSAVTAENTSGNERGVQALQRRVRHACDGALRQRGAGTEGSLTSANPRTVQVFALNSHLQLLAWLVWWCRRYRTWGLEAAVGAVAGLVAMGWAERLRNLTPELLEVMAAQMAQWGTDFGARGRSGVNPVRDAAHEQLSGAWTGAGDVVHALSWLSRRENLGACECGALIGLHARGDNGCEQRPCVEASGYWELARGELITAAALTRLGPRTAVAVAAMLDPAAIAAEIDATAALVVNEAIYTWRAAANVEAWLDREELAAYLRAGLFVAGDVQPLLTMGAVLREPGAFTVAPGDRCRRDGCGDAAEDHEVAGAGLGRGRCGAPACGCSGFVGGSSVASVASEEPLPVTVRERRCPCGSCVTCACGAAPAVDEDGLCLRCGGQPLAICARVTGDVPHVGSDVEGADRGRIAELIAAQESATKGGAS